MGFISYTYNTNGFLPPEGHEYAINYIPEFYTIEPLIATSRPPGQRVNLVALTCTGGWNTNTNPPRQKEMAVELARAGADLIIGTHSHVLQPIDLISVPLADGTTHKAVVIYALGNFCTNQHLTKGFPPI